MRDLVAWLVLALLFLVELLAVAGAAVWGTWAGGWLLGTAAAVGLLVVWGLFASPKAPYRSGARRPLAKLLVFGLTTVGLWASGHEGWAVGFLTLVLLVHAAAALPFVRRAVPEVG
jgi:hypothetical protein